MEKFNEFIKALDNVEINGFFISVKTDAGAQTPEMFYSYDGTIDDRFGCLIFEDSVNPDFYLGANYIYHCVNNRNDVFTFKYTDETVRVRLDILN